MEKSFDTELLILGGGGAGTTAAISAAEEGVRDILLLEKGSQIGGAAKAALGLFAVNSVLQKEEGIECDAASEFRDIMHSTSYLANAPLLKLFLDNSADTVQWLLDHGLDLVLAPENLQISHSLSPRVYHRWDHLPKRFEHLRKIMEQEGVRILTRCSATKLLQDEKGAVIGAKAKDEEGNILTIRAKAVLITTGGYAGNRDMLMEALSDVLDYEPLHLTSLSTGDGLQMAWQAGAAKVSERSMICHGITPGEHLPPGITHTDQAIMNIPILWVNRSGERFINEEVVFDSQFFGNACLAQGGIIYVIFDQASVEEWKQKTIPYEMNFWDHLGENGTHFPAAVKDFDQEFAKLQSIGSGFVSETPDGLADQLGWDRDIFQNTLERYNTACDKGFDDQFYKNARYLRYPVRTGPFYALRGRSFVMATVGGVRVDTMLRALTPDYKVIPHLYVAGADAGGIYQGHSYLPKEGFALGWALTTGRIAGETIARSLQQQ